MSNNKQEKIRKKERKEILRLIKEAKDGGCPLPEQLIALVRGILPAKDRILVENHTVFCDECSKEYITLEELERQNLGELKISNEEKKEAIEIWEENYSYESEMFAKAAKEANRAIIIKNMKDWTSTTWVNGYLIKRVVQLGEID